MPYEHAVEWDALRHRAGAMGGTDYRDRLDVVRSALEAVRGGHNEMIESWRR